jgi:hypothetical protein
MFAEVWHALLEDLECLEEEWASGDSAVVPVQPEQDVLKGQLSTGPLPLAWLVALTPCLVVHGEPIRATTKDVHQQHVHIRADTHSPTFSP